MVVIYNITYSNNKYTIFIWGYFIYLIQFLGFFVFIKYFILLYVNFNPTIVIITDSDINYTNNIIIIDGYLIKQTIIIIFQKKTKDLS